MHKLSLTVTSLLIAIFLHAQSPHGKDFKIDCAQCHTSDNWSINKAAMQFNHDSTHFKLTGQHRNANCRDCHSSLVFKDKRQSCMECHNDIHNNTLGKDCGRCHTPETWLIQNTRELHLQSRFPLLGAHRMADCMDCHTSSSRLQFEPIGVECSNCHMNDFQSTTSPNHVLKGFSTNCAECHSASSYNWNTATVNHDFFPLTAGHAIGCTECHISGNFDKLPTECNSCHQKNYNEAQLPSHVAAGIPNACANCHTTASWKPSSFNHITTGFELKGGHQNVVQCSDCHKGNLSSAQPQCISCHQVQYDNALNHKQLGYPTDCTKCHSQTNWLQSSFNHSTTSFPLTGAHTSVECNSCHTGGFAGTSTECNSCHQKNYNEAQLPGHVAAGIPNTCATCHTTTAYKPSTFRHTSTGFELKGGHQNIVQCSDCHKGNLNNAQPQCISCHQVQYDNALNHKQLGYPTDCTKCHSQTNWLQSSFNHSTTSFPLTGAHTSVECNSCHTGGFAGTSTECNSCHQKNYNEAQLPSHMAAGIPNTCATCHTTTAYKPSTFRHTSTGFELKGEHQNVVQCSDCHKGNLSSAKAECISCHQVQYDNAPNHKQLSYPTDCTNCHSQTNWLQSSFNHSTNSFPLTGAHTSVECNSCHSGGFAGTPTECNSCHQKDFTAAQLPSHTAAGIPNTCATCHTTTAYKPSTFRHTSTGFELKGGHQNVVQCSDCHKGNLSSAKAECISCHQVQYDNALNHKQLGYPTDCTKCHSQTNWLQSSFNHSTTSFPLTGAHTSVECNLCHTGGFAGTSTECNSCHQKNYNEAQLPSHVNAGIPNTCATCHTTASWKPSSFNHITTGFELKGGHQNVVQCSDCHKGNLSSAKAECISCHQVQYDNALNHKQLGYPTDCTKCHSQTNWLQSSFNHSTTSFPLTGAHTSVECNLCHTGGFAGTSTECNSCHQKNYNEAQLPSHMAAGIPNACANCHTTASWKPSSFNHIATGFELKGGHQNIVQCSDCHKGNLSSAQSQCISCHQVQYDNAPGHKQFSYPTDCTRCHSQSNWLENIFNHTTTGFQLTGAHISVTCATCHSSGFPGTPTTCFGCHSDSYSSTTNPNHKGAGFPTTCATCHSTTNWTSSTFNHSAYFPITNSRHNVSCATCHTNPSNYTVFSCVTSGCHTRAHNQNQGSAGCYRCHPTGRGD